MKVVMDAAVFKQLINNAKKFLGSNDRMQYICLEFDGGHVTATALDGYRVSRETAKVKEHTKAFKCFIKPNIPKITSNDINVTLELDNNRLLVTVGDNITGYVQPEITEFYNVEKIIENSKADEPKASVWVDPKLLKEALESCGVVGSYKSAVKLEISSDKRAPIKIWYGKRDAENNLKLVMPVNHPD